jgi:hypothetical protein
MFVQINPDVESYSETISTLKFAERVSGIELGAARSNKEGKDMKELLEQVLYSSFYLIRLKLQFNCFSFEYLRNYLVRKKKNTVKEMIDLHINVIFNW